MNAPSDDNFVFAPEAPPNAPVNESLPSVKILSVEDNLHYQEALILGLRSLTVENAQLNILTAGSATEAADVIARNPDISVILLDVVMEEDDAGLHLVNTIRNVLGNSLVRIILLTGQPGFAPRRNVMSEYDINEYWQKSDLDAEKLRGVILSNIRSWKTLHELASARKGLELLIAATRSLATKTDIRQFCQVLLEEITNLVSKTRGGIICTHGRHYDNSPEPYVVAASGSFKGQQPPLLSGKLADMYEAACTARTHQFKNDISILYFETKDVDNSFYITIVESAEPLSGYSINLLQAFSENVSAGFNNVALLNKVTQLAYHDPVLGTPNRAAFHRELASMHPSERQACQLITVEIQNYSEIMLMAGETLALSLLEEVHQLLIQVFPAHLVISRTSKDAFTLILSGHNNCDELALSQLSNSVLEVSGMQLHAQLRLVHLDMSLINPHEASQVLHLIEAALAVCRLEKKQLLSIQPDFKEGILNRYQLLQGLNKALLNDELFVALQPQISMQTGQLSGFEALVRWKKEDGQQVSPSEFIPVAETSGLITQVDSQVLTKTLAAISQLHQLGYSAPCSCNLTNADLTSPRFLAQLFEQLDTLDFPPNLLGLEVTETQAMENYAQINPTLKQLISRGVEVYIDDFGTGHSSLSHITQLAATHLKIDQSFVSAMQNDIAGEHVVDMIIRLGQRFGFGIVAEGVETQQQLETLTTKGCHVAQGFLIAKPMPLDELIPWLQEHFPAR